MAKKGGAGGIIVVAVILGLVTAYLIWGYFRKLDEKSRENWEVVVVARQDIPTRKNIAREMLELTEFPKDKIAENVARRVEDVEGRMASRSIRAGDQIRLDDLVEKGTVPTLAYKIPEGMRAIAIGAGEVQAVGTSVQPGDRVDLLVTYQDPRSRQELTKILLQNILVLAVNRGQTEPGQGEGGASSSMTLAVRPEQTELVAAADRQGALKVSLRPVNDAQMVATEGITTRDFLGIPIPEPVPVTDTNTETRIQPVVITAPSASKTRPEITVIRGTQQQVVSP